MDHTSVYSKVAIVILNWNGSNDTIKCIESIYKINYLNYFIVLVDNGSNKASLSELEEYFHRNSIHLLMYNKIQAELGGDLQKEEFFSNAASNKSLRLILNKENYGFAEGNNIGIRYSLKALNPDHILILNNDTIVDAHFLDELVKVAEKDEKIGIIGPAINGFHKEENWITGARILFWRGGIPKEYNMNQVCEVDMVSGCCMLIKKEVIDQIGLLDSTYFFGWEDADFCVKANRKGFKIMCNPRSKIWHKVGGSYGGYYANNPYVLREGVKNQLIFFNRYATLTQKLFSIPVVIMQIIFTILWRSNSFEEIIIKTSAIKKGLLDFLKYKEA